MGARHVLPTMQGESHPNAKMTEAKVRTMRRLYERKFFCIKCLSNIYKLSYSQTWDIVNYRYWIHVR